MMGSRGLGEGQPQAPFPPSRGLAGSDSSQVIKKERPQLTECEEPSIYSPAFPREKWQRKRTQVKIRVRALPLEPSRARPCLLSPGSPPLKTFRGPIPPAVVLAPPPHASAPPLGTTGLLP